MNLKLWLVVVGVALTGCDQGEDTAALEKEVAALRAALTAVQGRLATLEASTTAADLAAVDARVAALEDKTEPITRVEFDGHDALVVSGVNVVIQNGMGMTASENGVGNLIVGYHEPSGIPQGRSGSHNLIVGEHHDYTSHAGVVFGASNEIHGRYASVLGGYLNNALGDGSVVCGGTDNTANGTWAVVTGGADNLANGEISVVTGGFQNETSGLGSVVGGGSNLTNDTGVTWLGEGTINAP